MFGLSFFEVLIVLVVALLVLGPTGLPKAARTLGKTLRDFKRTTGDLRAAMEDEFYKLDDATKSLDAKAPDAKVLEPASDPSTPEGVIARADAAPTRSGDEAAPETPPPSTEKA